MGITFLIRLTSRVLLVIGGLADRQGSLTYNLPLLEIDLSVSVPVCFFDKF